MCLHSPPLLDSYLKREKNCFSLKVPSDIQRAFSFTRLLNTTWQSKRGISITFLNVKRPFQNIKPFPTSFKFQNYAEVFLPSDIQIGMVVRFLRNIQTMLFIISCQSIQSISLQVIPVFAGASQLSAEQEHQREQVNHLALTSGGDLFPRLHLFPQLFT